MLKERTSSATQLRVESSLRHSIRNLRAKVKSILPQQLCPKQIQRYQHNFFYRQTQPARPSPLERMKEIAKQMNKEFEKFNLRELEEIANNKPYFLGTQQAIEYFQNYIAECHPEMKSKEFLTPQQPHPKDNLTLSFIPFNLTVNKGTPARHSRKSSSSFKQLVQKRAVTAGKRGSTNSGVPNEAFQHKKHSLVEPDNGFSSSPLNYGEKALLNQVRKQDIEQYDKVKRQICYDYWKKQIQGSSKNKQKNVQEKVDLAKFRHSASKLQEKYDKHAKRMLEEHEVASLTSKLRKVCLKRKKEDKKQH